MELALRTRNDCPSCSGEMLELPEVIHVPFPGFRTGGYGEAVRVRAAICPDCWTVRDLSRESVNPLRYAGAQPAPL